MFADNLFLLFRADVVSVWVMEAGLGTETLHGGRKSEERQEALERFRSGVAQVYFG